MDTWSQETDLRPDTSLKDQALAPSHDPKFQAVITELETMESVSLVHGHERRTVLGLELVCFGHGIVLPKLQSIGVRLAWPLTPAIPAR